jgi:Uma2 family endonuclease
LAADFVLDYTVFMLSWSPGLALQTAPSGPRLEIEEWTELPEESPGELVDGYLTEEEVPDPIHELAVTWLITLFRRWLGERGGFVLGSDVKFLVSSTRGRKSDVSVYLPERLAPPRRGVLRDPPDIMVEVVTPSPVDERRDRVEKMGEYAAFGVRLYWLVDPALGSVEIFELHEGRFARALAATSGSLRDIPGCAGLTVDLDELWRELARLNPND